MKAVHLGSYSLAAGLRTRVRLLFSTHDPEAGANIAPLSAFEAADLRIYRAATSAAFSDVQRSSANGITMTSPFDSLTGFHGIDIDLTDNSDAGFYAAGYIYAIVLAPDETIDGQTITAVVLGYFEIGAENDLFGIVSIGTMAAGGDTVSGTLPSGQRANVKVGDILSIPSTGDRGRIKTYNSGTGAWTIDAGETFGTDPSSLPYLVFVNPINLPFVAADFGDEALTDEKFETDPSGIKAKTDLIPATATIPGTVSAGAHTVTTIIASNVTGHGDDVLNGRGLRFLTGDLAGLLVKITDYVSATGRLDFQNLLGAAAPTAPAETDTFEIV